MPHAFTVTGFSTPPQCPRKALLTSLSLRHTPLSIPHTYALTYSAVQTQVGRAKGQGPQKSDEGPQVAPGAAFGHGCINSALMCELDTDTIKYASVFRKCCSLKLTVIMRYIPKPRSTQQRPSLVPRFSPRAIIRPLTH